MIDIYKLITGIEKSILVLIAIFTIYGVGAEMYQVFSAGVVKLTDLLLMFIYAEVLGTVLPALSFSNTYEDKYKELKDALPKHKSKYAPGKKVQLQFEKLF